MTCVKQPRPRDLNYPAIHFSVSKDDCVLISAAGGTHVFTDYKTNEVMKWMTKASKYLEQKKGKK
jgi:hypothetical protein